MPRRENYGIGVISEYQSWPRLSSHDRYRQSCHSPGLTPKAQAHRARGGGPSASAPGVADFFCPLEPLSATLRNLGELESAREGSSLIGINSRRGRSWIVRREGRHIRPSATQTITTERTLTPRRGIQTLMDPVTKSEWHRGDAKRAQTRPRAPASPTARLLRHEEAER